MSIPRRHHFLPQSYLERFTNDGVLWLLDRTQDAIRAQTPINTAVLRDYYTIVYGSGAREHGLESVLSEIESEAKHAVDVLLAGDGLNARARNQLSFFVALLMTRVPAFEREFNQNAEAEIKRALFDAHPTPEHVERAIASLP